MIKTYRVIKLYGIYIKHIICIAFLFASTQLNARNIYRRHFIIAYDISGPFISAERNTPQYKQSLIDLFSNKIPSSFNDAYRDNLFVEKKNGWLFFDPQLDEITFFHFNVGASEFERLRWTGKNYSEKEIISEFNKVFLKNKNFFWSSFSVNGNRDVSQYVNQAFSNIPSPGNFGAGVSMSNFVYPLVLGKIDTSKYAEEYILIILSDFLSGAMLGNTKDFERIRDIYRVSYDSKLPSKSPVTYIKKEIDQIASRYYKIDFFQYSYIVPYSSNRIGIIGYKIKPKAGILTPEDVAFFIDGDINLTQRGYRSVDFKTDEAKVKFTHNRNIVPNEVRLKIVSSGNGNDRVLFDKIIAEKDKSGKWVSDYNSSDHLMEYDSVNQSYFLPVFNISLDSSINDKNYKYLKLHYEFSTQYGGVNAQPLNFIYKTKRLLPIEQIHYSTKVTVIIMYIVLPVIVIMLFVVLLLVYGKPRALFLALEGYLDSFEIISYMSVGKLTTPYKSWDGNVQREDFLVVRGEVQFKSEGYLLNWRVPVYLRLQSVTVPTGFELFLKPDTESIKEYSLDHTLVVPLGKNNTFSFIVGIRQNDLNKKLVEPELVKVNVQAAIKVSKLFIKSHLERSLEYKFHIGMDMGDVWVGFDPGTTGSCVAVGTTTNNIVLSETGVIDKKITPSIIAFEKSADFNWNGSGIPRTVYKFGKDASAVYKTARFQSFQSIKKLLGFTDVKVVEFDNKIRLELAGKDLAGLLVKGLFTDLRGYVENLGTQAKEYKDAKNNFNPQRAVVAIPNNFTISKIQDMVDCVNGFNQFREVRYVYEAEAVLFYYLSNYSRFNKKDKVLDSETILVFDMGGATINTTIVTVDKNMVNGRPKYDIDFLGKLGYGIGGDTIDYCIVKTILDQYEDFPDFKGVDLFSKGISAMASDIKKELARRYYYTSEEYLINPVQLEQQIESATGVKVQLTKEIENEGHEDGDILSINNHEPTPLFKLFKRSNTGGCQLLNHQIFKELVYDNVVDSVKEVWALAGNIHIDKVIFSGRSTAFPLIKETVEKTLNVKENKIERIKLDLEESKTAVAHGACWYGINKNSVRLNNLKTNASFGFKKTMSPDVADVKFHELVQMGCAFDTTNDGIQSFNGVEIIRDDFAFDGNKVHFLQIMGKNASDILSKDQKHKYSKIASINIGQVTTKVGINVNENDRVDCVVVLESNQKLEALGVVVDQEVGEANAEHYTWTVK